jgi:hypothetical protein
VIALLTKLGFGVVAAIGLVLLYLYWAAHLEQVGVDRATAIHEKQMIELERKATAQRIAHQAQMRSAELSATQKIAALQANTRTVKAKLHETAKHLDDCRLGADAVRLLNDAASSARD